MNFSLAVKCWAVVLSFSMVAMPLYAQAQDTAAVKQQAQPEPLQQGQQPAQVYQPVQQTPPPVSSQIQNVSKMPRPTSGTDFDEYLRGKMDGKRDAKGSGWWVLAGLAGTGLCLLIGCAGIGLAFVVPPSPREDVLMGKSMSYIMGYVEGYKSKGRLMNAGWATFGCTLAALINLTINLASGKSATNY